MYWLSGTHLFLKENKMGWINVINIKVYVLQIATPFKSLALPPNMVLKASKNHRG